MFDPMKTVLALTLMTSLAACGSSPGASPGAGGASSTGSTVGGGGTTGPGGSGGGSMGSGNGYSWAFAPTSVEFDCADTKDQIAAKGVTALHVGATTLFVGSEQVGATDQDPIVARFDGTTKVFCEHSKKGGGVDGRAYGVTWDGGSNLYVVYTIVGGGTLFDTVCAGGWIGSYGDGGGSAKVTVIGKLDAQTGVVKEGTFVPAHVLKNGQTKTNTLVPADALHALPDGTFELLGKPAYCTLNPDRSLMCDPSSSKDYPQDYRARFSADLATMLCASASGVSKVSTPCP